METAVRNGLVVLGTEARLQAGDLTLLLDLAAGARVLGATCARRPRVPLLDRWWCGYEAGGQVWSDAPRGGECSFGLGPARVTYDEASRAGEVAADVVAPHLRVSKRFTLYPDLPFVRVRYRMETTGVEGLGPGLAVGLPAIAFTDALADAFDLPEDRADDGLDLGGGLALPAWRAFGDTAGAFGLLLFAADRQVMSRLHVTGRGCAFRPGYYLAYSTNVVTTREVRFGLQHHNYGPVDELDWFLGAFRRDDLPALRRLMSAFHARRRPAGDGEALEFVPGVSPWGVSPWDDARRAGDGSTGGEADLLLPPTEALPRPWPAAVTFPAGGTATRHFLLPGAANAWQPVETHAGGVIVVARPVNRQPQYATVHISASPDAPPGTRSVSVPLPAGQLDVVVDVSPSVPLPRGDQHVVIGAADMAERARAAGWSVVAAPELPGGVALLQRPGAAARPIQLEPDLRGSYDVFVGVAQSAGIKFKLDGELDGEPYWSYVHAERADPGRSVDIQSWQLLETICRLGAGSGPHGEVFLRRATFDGGGLQLAPHPFVHAYTVISHVRFAPAPPPEPPRVFSGRRRYIAGLADIPDVGNDIGADALQEEAWREVVAQHARVGIDTVYWRVDGQCPDFHTRIGTVRYSVPRTHTLYSPRFRTYGRALERLDPLRIAVDEKQHWGLRLLGWMRTNNYSGNVVARFFVEHPEWHERREDGSPAPQLCLAVPEVRAHKAAILREAVAYGLDGLLIDTLRHPPMVGYHPVVVEAYKKEYGEDPPREPESRLLPSWVEQRTGERWERWFRFRAQFFAQFLRDIRAGLAADGYDRLPIHVRVAPTRYLHDGADLEALLEEGLVDAVVASRYVADPLDYELLFPVVRDRVPICAICDPIRGDREALLRQLQRDERLGGVGIYESNRMVHTAPYRDTLLEIARSMG
ncbi:MAG: hypothetical protein HY332_03490 [Chloroflexi bacterium]|nr:hypothetical protein [Chloroflexota bacterium]